MTKKENLKSQAKGIDQVELDRQAELTLLSLTLDLNEDQLRSTLEEFGVPRAEYDYLLEKYSRVVTKYMEQQEQGAKDEQPE